MGADRPCVARGIEDPAGAVTITVAWSIGTSTASPIAFQYSSSWSGKPFTPPHRVDDRYVWTPVTVASGSPILIRVMPPGSVGNGEVGGRPARGGDRLDVQGVDAVVSVVVPLSRRHVAEDPVMLSRTEVVLDGLGDRIESSASDLDLDVVGTDRFARLRACRCERPQRHRCDAGDDQGGDAFHRCSTKKKDMAMMTYAPTS